MIPSLSFFGTEKNPCAEVGSCARTVSIGTLEFRIVTLARS